MSVGLFKYDGDMYSSNSELVLSENIASQRFYNEHWERAVIQHELKFMCDDAEIRLKDLPNALHEIEILLNWAKINLSMVNTVDYEYMKERLENLRKVIPEELKNVIEKSGLSDRFIWY